MTIENIYDQSPRKNVTNPAGSNPQPTDHQSDAHPTEPPRLAWEINSRNDSKILVKVTWLNWDLNF